MIRLAAGKNDIDLRSAMPAHADAFRIVPKTQNGNVVFSDEAGTNAGVIKTISEQIKAALSKIDDSKTRLLDQMVMELEAISTIEAAKEEELKKQIEIEKANPEKRNQPNVDTSKSGSGLLNDIINAQD